MSDLILNSESCLLFFSAIFLSQNGKYVTQTEEDMAVKVR